MGEQSKKANELKLLLANWQLEKLYETFLDEDIFIEELEMMTEEHLHVILKSCKMGVRIRFEHHFKKWRLAKGKPLGLLHETATMQCDKCCVGNNSLTVKKAIATTDQTTQTASNLKIKQNVSTQTLHQSAFVKIQHGAEQLRQVLNKINKNNTNNQSLTITKTKLAVTSDSVCEQPTTTTFHDVVAATAPLPNLSLKSPNTSITNRSIPAILSKTFIPTTTVTVQQPTTSAVVTAKPQLPRLQAATPPKLFVGPTTPDTTAAAAKPKPIIPKASLKRHSVEDNCGTRTKQRLNSNLNVLRKHSSKTLKNPKTTTTEAGNAVVDMLLAAGNQGYQLLQQYHQNQAFTALQRELLMQIICEFYLKQKLNFHVEVSDKVTDYILVLFPSERLENYDKGVQGKIYKQYLNMKSQFVHTSETVTLSDSSDMEFLSDDQAGDNTKREPD